MLCLKIPSEPKRCTFPFVVCPSALLHVLRKVKCKFMFIMFLSLIFRTQSNSTLLILNADVPLFQKVPAVKEEEEPEEEDEEEMGHAETYAEYMPIKCMT